MKQNPNPTRAELAHGVSGNLCRCQDYSKILDALMRGGEYMRGGVGKEQAALLPTLSVAPATKRMGQRSGLTALAANSARRT
jgi:xanthine dehydrogenase iron-sulfur cluster and FAD-binding subunit A